MHRDRSKGGGSFEDELKTECQNIPLNSSVRPQNIGMEMKTYFFISRPVSGFMIGVGGVMLVGSNVIM